MHDLSTFAFSSHDFFGSRVAVAVAVTALFALWARWLKGVTPDGALAGFVIAFSIFLALGISGFVVLFAVFLLTAAATRWRRDLKAQYGKAPQPNGRTARQVLANCAAASVIAVACIAFPTAARALLPGLVAALAEAAADTVSSETGEALRGRTFMLTTFRRVDPGPDGAISLGGTFCGLVAAFVIGAFAWITGLLSPEWSLLAAACGFAGMLFDSLLGATLESRGLLANDGVNFISTIFAADVALLLSFLLF